MITLLSALALTLSLTIAIAPGVQAAQTVDVRVNGELIAFDEKPYIDENKRTMIPVRFVAEELGATVNWDRDIQGAVIEKDGIRLELPIGSNVMTITQNGQTSTKTLDTAAVLKNGRTLVPIRAVAETLGAWVSFSGAYQTVQIWDDVLTPEEINTLHAIKPMSFQRGSDSVYNKLLQGNWVYENLTEHADRAFTHTANCVLHSQYVKDTLDTATATQAEIADYVVKDVCRQMTERFNWSNLYGITGEFKSDASCIFAKPVNNNSSIYHVYGILTITCDEDADPDRLAYIMDVGELAKMKPGQTYTYLMEIETSINYGSGGVLKWATWNRTNGSSTQWS